MIDRKILVTALAQVELLASDLAGYSSSCADAREWGGPTIYPRHPVDEHRARVDAAAILKITEVLREALNKPH